MRVFFFSVFIFFLGLGLTSVRESLGDSSIGAGMGLGMTYGTRVAPELTAEWSENWDGLGYEISASRVVTGVNNSLSFVTWVGPVRNEEFKGKLSIYGLEGVVQYQPRRALPLSSSSGWVQALWNPLWLGVGVGMAASQYKPLDVSARSREDYPLSTRFQLDSFLTGQLQWVWPLSERLGFSLEWNHRVVFAIIPVSWYQLSTLIQFSL